VETVGQYQAYVRKFKKKEIVQLLFRRGNSHVFVVQFGKE
jgi:hypothetical protein